MVNLTYAGTHLTDGLPDNSTSCVTAFDQAGFMMGTSASLFNVSSQQFQSDRVTYWVLVCSKSWTLQTTNLSRSTATALDCCIRCSGSWPLCVRAPTTLLTGLVYAFLLFCSNAHYLISSSRSTILKKIHTKTLAQLGWS